jgi:hypothetical protein
MVRAPEDQCREGQRKTYFTWLRPGITPKEIPLNILEPAMEGASRAESDIHANSKMITLADGHKVFAGSSADTESK